MDLQRLFSWMTKWPQNPQKFTYHKNKDAYSIQNKTYTSISLANP